MLVVREAQLAVFAAGRREAFVAALLDHVERFFPGSLAGWPRERARAQLHATIDEAAGYGLVSRRDVSRFANLGARYGWDFLDRPANAWMREQYLANDAAGTPSERLDRLVAACLWQDEVAAHDAGLSPPPAGKAAADSGARGGPGPPQRGDE